MAYVAVPQPYSSVVASEVEFIADPVIPFRRPVDSLCDAYVITVSGKVKPDANRFHLNLKQGKKRILHLNPRFDQKQVVRNTKQGGQWGEPEKDGEFPLERDQSFDMMILVTDSCYKIAFNGKHYCDYKHRIPMEGVDKLAIKGDVVLNSVKITDPHKSLDMPFFQALPRGSRPGTVVRIHGRPKEGANRFAFDFLSEDKEKIAFHFNPRFQGNVVVRNTKGVDGWGKEEREQPSFPFKAGKDFHVTIYSDSDKFQVSVDGEYFISYKHRMDDLSQICFLRATGDMELYSIEI